MKYTIKRKRLPSARREQTYTLIISLGTVYADTDRYEAKIQFPVSSYRDGIYRYRQFLREQKELKLAKTRPSDVSDRRSSRRSPTVAPSSRPCAIECA